MEIPTWRSAIADLKGTPPGAPSGVLGEGTPAPQLGLAVRCGDLTLQRKNMPFCTFFTCSQKYQNGVIFVNTEGFRPCLSKPSYRAPKWALMVRLMQKERLKSPKKSLITENQAFGVIWQFWPKRPYWSFWPAIPNQAGHAEKKSQLRSCVG